MKLNNEQFLHQLYKEILNREPDQYGFEQHLRNLSRGVKKNYHYFHFFIKRRGNINLY